MADKYVICLIPWWLFVLMTWHTGELAEYRKGQNGRTPGTGKTVKQWQGDMQTYLRGWIKQNRYATR